MNKDQQTFKQIASKPTADSEEPPQRVERLIPFLPEGVTFQDASSIRGWVDLYKDTYFSPYKPRFVSVENMKLLLFND